MCTKRPLRKHEHAPSPAVGRAARLLLAALTLGGALLPSPAAAVDRQDPRAMGTMKTTTDYLTDLSGPEGPDRLFAARVLRARVDRALDALTSASADSLEALEARAVLDELSRELPPRCVLAMGQEAVVPACADSLAQLGAVEAVPALRAARDTATRRRTRRAVDRALEALNALPSPAPSTPVAPTEAPAPVDAAPPATVSPGPPVTP